MPCQHSSTYRLIRKEAGKQRIDANAAELADRADESLGMARCAGLAAPLRGSYQGT